MMNYCRRRTKYFLRISESLTGDPGERKTRRKINTIILPPRNQDHFDTTTMVNHIFLWLWFYEILLRFASRIIRTIKHNSKTEDAGKLINIKFWERKYFWNIFSGCIEEGRDQGVLWRILTEKQWCRLLWWGLQLLQLWWLWLLLRLLLLIQACS